MVLRLSETSFVKFVKIQPLLTIRWPGGGGRECLPPPKGVRVFLRNRESFYPKKFLAVGTSLWHLSMKNFPDWSYRLDPKIRQRQGAGRRGVATPY